MVFNKTMEVEDFQDIIYKKEPNGILTVTLNRPERKNALSPLTLLELWHAVNHAEEDEEIRVMILTGCEEANAFCSGGYFSEDMFEKIPQEYRKEIDIMDMASKKLCLKFWDFTKPIITAINGLAVGGGFTLPLVCSDLNYIAEDAWIALYFIKRAVMTDFATSYLLPLVVGFQKAKELFFMGEKLSAQEAYEFNLGINKVLPKKDLMPYVRKQAFKLIPPKAPSVSIKLMKQAMHSHYREILKNQLDLENKYWKKTLRTKDFNESLKALTQKREPKFIGK
ncbi:MAG: 3-hydroxypropionyl-coenzyme A dehydratase [Promethearchaeota archaeon]|nr:MAG: 3-hydroxypropionyl-coenzyme A dehydratase [Candidatus Lokiarchaeota archaeon]